MNINLTIKQLINVVEGTSSLDPSFCVERIASVEAARSKDLAIIFDPDEDVVFDQLSDETIKKCQAGAILSSKPVVAGKPYILVNNPLDAFTKLVRYISRAHESVKKAGKGRHRSAVISTTAVLDENVIVEAGAIIEDDVRISEGTVVGAQVYIGKQCTIGKNVVLHPGVKILDRSIIGDFSILHAGAVIGSDGFGYRIAKNGLQKIPHIGIVRIGRNVEIGANACIDRAAFEETVIGDGVKIDNMVQISHNSNIGASTAILAHSAIAGSVRIGVGCQIGGQVAVRDHVTIGNRVKIVSKSGVMKNLRDGEIVAGIPSMPFPRWKRLTVMLSNFHTLLKPLSAIKKNKKSLWRKIFRCE